MLLQVEHRKIRCDRCCKVRVEALEFVAPHARVTHRLAAYAAWAKKMLAEWCSVARETARSRCDAAVD